jgi:hypothetical protein
MVNADALTSLANLKASLKVTGTSDDAYLEQLINRATSWIEQRTNRKDPDGKYGLKARRYNGAAGSAPDNVHPTTSVPDEDFVYFDGTRQGRGGHTIVNPDTGLAEFHLPAFPVQTTAASGVAFKLDVLTSRTSSGEVWDTTSLIEFDSFVVDRPAGVLRLTGGTFTEGMRNYRVTMAAGLQYGSNAPFVPPDLEGLCVEVCKKLYLENEGVQSESLGTWSRSYNLDRANAMIDQSLERFTRYSL